MSCYIISFQSKERETRQNIRPLLKTYQSYCAITNTCWAVVTDLKAKQIRDQIGELLQPGDRLFVVRSGTEGAWLGNEHLAGFAAMRYHAAMSQKEIVIEAIQELPDDASMDQIVDRVEFMAAIQKGIDDVERGETIPHTEVKKQLAAWLTE